LLPTCICPLQTSAYPSKIRMLCATNSILQFC